MTPVRESVLQKQAVSQMQSISQVQDNFLAIHNDLLQEVNRKKNYHDVKKHYSENQTAFKHNPMFMIDAMNQ